MEFSKVSEVLWQERQLLDLMVFKLQEKRLLLESGDDRWLPWATRELEIVMAELRRAELLRAIEVEELGRELGLSPGPTLAEVADAAPSPWSELFVAHRFAFQEALSEIEELAGSNEELLQEGMDDIAERISMLSGATGQHSEV